MDLEHLFGREGTPLELSGSKEFPRLLNGSVGEVDVIQIMQDVDPDVDANWRLLHSFQELPFHWKINSPLVDNLVSIDSFRWAPFNAQATILSRRAGRIGMVLHTVHERVSDIWRSYLMQYLMKRFDNTGLLTFSGATVEHRRYRHDFDAKDQQAEAQLYAQVMKLIAYLDERPISKVDPVEEYFILVDDIYQRGFIHAQDVQAVLL